MSGVLERLDAQQTHMATPTLCVTHRHPPVPPLPPPLMQRVHRRGRLRPRVPGRGRRLRRRGSQSAGAALPLGVVRAPLQPRRQPCGGRERVGSSCRTPLPSPHTRRPHSQCRYICKALAGRLPADPAVRLRFVDPSALLLGGRCSVLVAPLGPHGSLQQLVNAYLARQQVGVGGRGGMAVDCFSTGPWEWAHAPRVCMPTLPCPPASRLTSPTWSFASADPARVCGHAFCCRAAAHPAAPARRCGSLGWLSAGNDLGRPGRRP